MRHICHWSHCWSRRFHAVATQQRSVAEAVIAHESVAPYHLAVLSKFLTCLTAQLWHYHRISRVPTLEQLAVGFSPVTHGPFS